MVNNLIFNPGRRAAHYNLLANEWTGQPYQTGRLSLVGNVYRQGPDTDPATPFFLLRGEGDVELFLDDNVALDVRGRPVAQTGNISNGKARILPLAAADLPPNLRVHPSRTVEAGLMASAGARPWDRDEIDRLLLADLAAGRGRIIDSEVEHAIGYPK